VVKKSFHARTDGNLIEGGKDKGKSIYFPKRKPKRGGKKRDGTARLRGQWAGQIGLTLKGAHHEGQNQARGTPFLLAGGARMRNEAIGKQKTKKKQ